MYRYNEILRFFYTSMNDILRAKSSPIKIMATLRCKMIKRLYVLSFSAFFFFFFFLFLPLFTQWLFRKNNALHTGMIYSFSSFFPRSTMTAMLASSECIFLPFFHIFSIFLSQCVNTHTHTHTSRLALHFDGCTQLFDSWPIIRRWKRWHISARFFPYKKYKKKKARQPRVMSSGGHSLNCVLR